MKTQDRLVAFLYLLIRDVVPFGEVVRLVSELNLAEEYELSNEPAGKLAISLAHRIRNKQKPFTEHNSIMSAFGLDKFLGSQGESDEQL